MHTFVSPYLDRIAVEDCAHEHYTTSGILDGACQMLRCLDCGALDDEW